MASLIPLSACFPNAPTHLSILVDHDVVGVAVAYTQYEGGHAVPRARPGERVDGSLVPTGGQK